MQLLVYNVDSLHTCTPHTWSFKNYVKARSVCRWRGVATGVAFGFPLLSLSCVLSFAVHATLYLRATLVTRGRVAFYMGPPVVPPYATFYISPLLSFN